MDATTVECWAVCSVAQRAESMDLRLVGMWAAHWDSQMAVHWAAY